MRLMWRLIWVLLSRNEMIARNRMCTIPDSKVHGADMWPTWDLSAPDGPHLGPVNLAIRDVTLLSPNRYLPTYQRWSHYAWRVVIHYSVPFAFNTDPTLPSRCCCKCLQSVSVAVCMISGCLAKCLIVYNPAIMSRTCTNDSLYRKALTFLIAHGIAYEIGYINHLCCYLPWGTIGR